MYSDIKNNIKEHLKANEALEHNGQWKKALFHLIIAAEEFAKTLVTVAGRSSAMERIPIDKDELNAGINHLFGKELMRHDFKLFLFIAMVKCIENAEVNDKEIKGIVARCESDMENNPEKIPQIFSAGLAPYIIKSVTIDLLQQAQDMAREWNDIKKACLYTDAEKGIGKKEITEEEYNTLKIRIMPILRDMLVVADLVSMKNPKAEALNQCFMDALMENGDFLEKLIRFAEASKKGR